MNQSRFIFNGFVSVRLSGYLFTGSYLNILNIIELVLDFFFFLFLERSVMFGC